jgi:hypothetical protein
MRRIVVILVQILLFIPRWVLRLVRGRRKPTIEAPPTEEETQPAEPEPPTEAPSTEEAQPPQATAEAEEE